MNNILKNNINEFYRLCKIAAEARVPRNIFEAMEWLGIEATDTLDKELIKKKYRKVIFENHPDRVNDKEAGAIKLIEADSAKRLLESFLDRKDMRDSPSAREDAQKEETRKETKAPKEDKPSEDPFAEYDRERRERVRQQRENARRERAYEETFENRLPITVGQLVWTTPHFADGQKKLGVVSSMNHVRNSANIRHPVSDSFGEISGFRESHSKITELIPFRDGEKVVFTRSSGKLELASGYSDIANPYALNVKWEDRNGTRLTRKIHISEVTKL